MPSTSRDNQTETHTEDEVCLVAEMALQWQPKKGTVIIRVRFWGPLCHNYSMNKEPPK